jgi:hypothetical protein
MGRKNKSRIAWHYTYSNHIDAILESAVLLPPSALLSGVATEMGISADIRKRLAAANQNVKAIAASKDIMKGVKADGKLLLFSENSVWEPASFRGIEVGGLVIDILKLEDYAKYGHDVYRIGVYTRHLKPYSQLIREVHMPKETATGLTKVANGGNPFQWWGSTKPVPQEKWVAIQKFVGGEWIDWLPQTAEKAKVSAA